MRITTATLLLFLAGALAVSAANVTVFAAASLTDALNQIAADYQKTNKDKIVFNFAGSSLLTRQIEESAPADIFFSADDPLMDELEKKGLIISSSRHALLGNSLVVVVPRDSPLQLNSIQDLLPARAGRLALADPAAVPAGVYAREYFQKKQLWDAIKPKVVPTANVRAALAAVASGNVDAGIVYKTDAAISSAVKIALSIPPADGPKIDYPVALVANSSNKTAAQHFLDYLESKAAERVFTRFGFIVRHATP